MNFSKAFDETLFRFKIRGRDLANKASISDHQVSKFRNGGNLRSDTIEKIMDALPYDARVYMLGLLLAQEQENDRDSSG